MTMDYVLGGVAALITGNVTPNRPRIMKKAFTPTKHQPSPNVTPKSELVDDRSIFLSPTVQKKKAIVKKSPKRIFQNPDITENNEDSTIVSPKAEKVKKHLKDDLEADSKLGITLKTKNKTVDTPSSPHKSKIDTMVENLQHSNENTPRKKKKNKDVIHSNGTQSDTVHDNNLSTTPKMKERRKSLIENIDNDASEGSVANITESENKKNNSSNIKNDNTKITKDAQSKSPNKKKNRKRKNKTKAQGNEAEKTQEINNPDHTNENNLVQNKVDKTIQQNNKKSKNKNKKNKKKQNTTNNQMEGIEIHKTEKDIEKQIHKIKNDSEMMEMDDSIQETQEKNADTNKIKKKKSKKKVEVNPNAITNKDSDSEHDSDDEIKSDSEDINKNLLEKDPSDSTSDEEDEEPKQPDKKKVENTEKRENDPNEVKRTLFVGNVPFSKKCKKEIKRIFSQYGQIETVRIRTIPVKDARDTPKLAIIKNELHPERSTVNVYVKFADAESIEKALAENNTVLNDHHLRVSRSDSTGAEHDPRCSVFVGNLPFALEDDVLRSKFENCGKIASVRIIRDKKTNAGKGFGYVNFKSKDGVELALALSEDDLTIKNRILRVKRCTLGGQKQGGNRFNQRGNKPFGRDQWNSRQVGSFGGQAHNESEGAYRRVMNKRKYQDGNGEGPPDKRQNTNQPRKEKKPRKEFVGMTAEKKKKHKFDKGQKKKKMLSEILTK